MDGIIIVMDYPLICARLFCIAMLGQYLQLNECGHFVNVPDHFYARARPMDYLLIWVLGGQGFAATEGKRIIATPGQLLSFIPGKAHRYGSDKNQPWNILWAHFQGKLAQEFVRSIRRPGGKAVELGMDDELRDRWIELVIAHAERPPGFATRCNTALYGLLGLIVHRLETRSRAPVAPSPLDVHRLQTYIHHHLAEPLTLESLARQANLSPPHFARVFRQRFGVSPINYVIQKRIALAGSLLTETAMPLKQISRAIGYADPYYFSRLFKKQTGRSPAAYRQARRPARQ
jgi:AraC-like DNA-binding protein